MTRLFLLGYSFDQSENFTGIRMPAQLFLGEYEFAVQHNFKHAALGFDQLHVCMKVIL